MLVLKLEVWPKGDPHRAVVLGRVEMENASDPPGVLEKSDYAVRFFHDGHDGHTRQGVVLGHVRDNGPWRLVNAALRAINLDGWE